MNYKSPDMDTYKRRAHFEYFNSLAYPYVGLTVNVDVTNLIKTVKAEKLPFFLTVCYCASQAANSVPEFRQRVLNNRIIEFDYCRSSHTVALEDETFCYCVLDTDMPFLDFLPYAQREQVSAKQKKSIDEAESDVCNKFFFSTVPWVSYTAIVQPVPVPADSNPRITWGKYFTQGRKKMMPVSVLCHHGLVDGIHIASFYNSLDQQIRAICLSYQM